MNSVVAVRADKCSLTLTGRKEMNMCVQLPVSRKELVLLRHPAAQQE